jgi:hypothetical protein
VTIDIAERPLHCVLGGIFIPALTPIVDPSESQELCLSVSRASTDETSTGEGSPHGTRYLLVRTLRGEVFKDVVYDNIVGASISDRAWTDRLVSNLQDFMADSTFGCGELRQPEG